MKDLIAIDEWLGLKGEPLDPAKMQFAARPGTTCRNCCFNGQRIEVCNKAEELARLAELPECGKEYVIYFLKPVDKRQIAIPGAE